MERRGGKGRVDYEYVLWEEEVKERGEVDTTNVIKEEEEQVEKEDEKEK